MTDTVEFMDEKPKVLFAARVYSAPSIHREYTFLEGVESVRSGEKPPMNGKLRECNNGQEATEATERTENMGGN
jgi:hypothetical protein